jgi:hypothetical protein
VSNRDDRARVSLLDRWGRENERLRVLNADLVAENKQLTGWLRRHARFNDELTDRNEWKEAMEFLEARAAIAKTTSGS